MLTSDWLASIGDIEVVCARLIWYVFYTTAAIFVISAGHFGLRRSLYSQPQSTCTGPTAAKQTWSDAENLTTRLIDTVTGFSSRLKQKGIYPPGLHCKLVRFVGDARLKSWTMYSHTCWVITLGHRHTERALGNWGVIVCNLNTVCAYYHTIQKISIQQTHDKPHFHNF